jgi:hypothetical protein
MTAGDADDVAALKDLQGLPHQLVVGLCTVGRQKARRGGPKQSAGRA